MKAIYVAPDRAEIRIPGTAGILLCDYSGATGEWTPVGIRIDGEDVNLGDLPLPACFTLNEEALGALEAIA